MLVWGCRSPLVSPGLSFLTVLLSFNTTEERLLADCVWFTCFDLYHCWGLRWSPLFFFSLAFCDRSPPTETCPCRRLFGRTRVLAGSFSYELSGCSQRLIGHNSMVYNIFGCCHCCWWTLIQLILDWRLWYFLHSTSVSRLYWRQCPVHESLAPSSKCCVHTCFCLSPFQ